MTRFAVVPGSQATSRSKLAVCVVVACVFLLIAVQQMWRENAGAAAAMQIGGPTLQTARAGHTAAVLPDGRIVIAGGRNDLGALSSIEFVDSVTLATTTAQSSLPSPRTDHAAVTLPGAFLFLSQGLAPPTTETTSVIVSSSEVVEAAPSASFPRASHTATVTSDMRVLLIGGLNGAALSASDEALISQPEPWQTSVFDPRTGHFESYPDLLTTRRSDHTATTLPDGKVLILGGRDAAHDLASAELLDPATGIAQAVAATMLVARSGHTATLLADGSVLIAGGRNNGIPLVHVEQFDPVSQTFSVAPFVLTVPRADHTATLLPDGDVLIAGGTGPGGATGSLERLNGPVDTLPPAVLHTFPGGGAVGVALNATLVVRFSEPVDITSVNTSTLQVTVGGQPIAGVTSTSESGLFATFVPSSSLTAGAQHVVTIDGVRDTAGHFLPLHSLSFATVADWPLEPFDGSVATSIARSAEFLYTGPNAVQIGVAEGALDPVRIAILRGKVFDRAGGPLPGVAISVKDHPEFGSTLTQADGVFDMAVNGGGLLAIEYRKGGFLPVVRQVDPAWREYAWLPVVSLTPLDNLVTTLDLSSPAAIQVARGNAVTDSDGTRTATLLFRQGTTATATLPNGATQPLSTLSIRATEYTKGNDGPAAMPGPLPPSSGYTYAADYTVDEALNINARSVTFSQPVISYVENFLGFSAGEAVPLGYFNAAKVAWEPSTNGVVLTVLSIDGGIAALDVTGSGQVSTVEELAVHGITDAERVTIAGLYTAGQSVWRLPIPHFSPWDANWPFFISNDAVPPNQRGPNSDRAEELSDPECASGSIIECENRVLGEDLPITGTSFHLSYRSNRRPRPGMNHTLAGPLTGSSVPVPLKRVELQIAVAGQLFEDTYPASPNQNYSFVWNGKDGYGRKVQGGVPARVRIGYTYDAVYGRATAGTRSFGQPGAVELSQNPARQEVTLWQVHDTMLGGWDASQQGLAGWNLSPHHAYDPRARVLYIGSGETRRAGAVAQVVATAAGGGGGACCSFPDGAPATTVTIAPAGPVKVAPDGTVYVTGGSDDVTIFELRRDGTLYRVGTGLGSVGAIGSDGSVYAANWKVGADKVHRVLPNGTTVVIAGTGTRGFAGDGGPADAAHLSSPTGVAVAADGTVYIADTFNARIRKVDLDGIITTVAGTGTSGYGGDGGPATAALMSDPRGLAILPDGSLLIADLQNCRVRRLGIDGRMTTFAGTGTCTSQGDGGPATLAGLRPIDVSVDRAGAVYVADLNGNRIRKISSNGLISTVAGNGQSPSGTVGMDGYGSPATGTAVSAWGVGVAHDGSVYIGDMFAGRVRRMSAALPDAKATDILIPSQDGSELFVFDEEGRHKRTLDAFTGGLRLTFTYNGGGLLTEIRDRDDNITTVERLSGARPVAIVAPGGQRTSLTTDSDGYLRTLTDPASNTYTFDYDDAGFLTELTDPRDNTHEFTYDESGNLERDEDPAGGSSTLSTTVSLSSSSLTATTTVTSAMSREKRFRVDYRQTGRERTRTDAAGFDTVTWQGRDGATTVTAPNGVVTTTTTDADPRWGTNVMVAKSVTIRMPSGLQFARTAARAVVMSDPLNPLSLQSQTDTYVVNGKTFASVFNASTRTTTTTTPMKRQFVTTVDAGGRVVQQQQGGLTPLAFSYDARGRLSTVNQGGRQYRIEYDAQNRPVRLIDPLARETTFAYDLADRVEAQTQPDGGVIGFGYSPTGKVTSLAPPGRPDHLFDYSPVDLLASYAGPPVPGSGESTYFYNLDKQLTSEFQPGGRAIVFGYNGGGRLDTMDFSRGQIGVTYSPATGLPATIAAPGVSLALAFDGSLPTGTTWSGAVSGTVSRTFDANFRVVSERINGSSDVTFQYDDDGLLTRASHQQAGSLNLTRHTGHGLITRTTMGPVINDWTYTGFGEVQRYTATVSSVPWFDQEFTRDDAGRITQVIETVQGLQRVLGYGYDLSGRLTSVTLNGLTPFRLYSYDTNGNRTSMLTNPGSPAPPVTATFDEQDRLLQQGAEAYTYTANGELATRTGPGGITQYTYDEFGNLVTVVLPDGRQIDYVIDGLHRRVGKKINGTLVRAWLYADQLRPVAELDGTGTVVARFVYATDTNVPDVIVRGSDRYRIIKDHLGSPRLVVLAGLTPTVVQQLDYDPFGLVVGDSNPGFQPFGFAGGLYDPDTKLVRFGSRDYDASTGRWTAKDAIGFDGRDTNLYGYVLSDPVNLIDPSGYIAPAVVGAAVGAAVGAVSGAAGAIAQNGSWADVLVGAGIGAGIGVTGATMGAGTALTAMLNAIADALGQGVAAAARTSVGACAGRVNISSLLGAAGSGAMSVVQSRFAGGAPGLAVRSPLMQEAVKGLASLPSTFLNMVGTAVGLQIGF